VSYELSFFPFFLVWLLLAYSF